MRKIDPTVKKETLYILIWCLIFSFLMNAVILIMGKWDLTILFGNILGVAAAVGNFFLMGFTIQIALEKGGDDAKGRVKLSQTARLLGLLAIALIAYFVPYINTVTAILPYLFPTVAVLLRPLFSKKEGGDGVG